MLLSGRTPALSRTAATTRTPGFRPCRLRTAGLVRAYDVEGNGGTEQPSSSSAFSSTGSSSWPPSEVIPAEVTPIREEATSSSAKGRHSHHDSQKARAQRRIETLKVQLLAALSSLDRGLAANAREAQEVDQLCSQLEGLGGPVLLRQGLGDEGTATQAASVDGGDGGDTDGSWPVASLAGTWRLVYSSGFNNGSLGGRRPGPPAALFPTVLGQVYQRIDPDTAKLDNIVELLFSYGGSGPLGLPTLADVLPRPSAYPTAQPSASANPVESLLGGVASGVNGLLGAVQGALGGAEADGERRESPAARLTLRHDYEISSPNLVNIVYEETYGELVGAAVFAQLPRLQAPSLPEVLRPPRFLRSATFSVTFLDTQLRITRGDRGELRVYLRDEEPGQDMVARAAELLEE